MKILLLSYFHYGHRMSTGRNSYTPFYNWGILGGSCTPPVVHRVDFTAFFARQTLGSKNLFGCEGCKIQNKIRGQKVYITHTNNKMSCRRPTPQRLCPLSPMQRPPHPQIIEPSLPMGKQHARGIGIALAAAGSFVWVNKFNASKIELWKGGWP